MDGILRHDAAAGGGHVADGIVGAVGAFVLVTDDFHLSTAHADAFLRTVGLEDRAISEGDGEYVADGGVVGHVDGDAVHLAFHALYALRSADGEAVGTALQGLHLQRLPGGPIAEGRGADVSNETLRETHVDGEARHVAATVLQVERIGQRVASLCPLAHTIYII